MTGSPLDHPVWNSLAAPHEMFALGGPLARRYMADVNVFAASRDNSSEALDALAALISPGAPVFLLQRVEIAVPPGVSVTKRATGVQMICDVAKDLPAPTTNAEAEMQPLGHEDAPMMLDLAHLTEPGPFAARTHAMGNFIGIRRNGRLVAMAGTRLTVPGYREISGVCVHPDFRGQGLARRLSIAMSRRIFNEGETPFLHAWATNTAAIALYETIGFRHANDVNVAVLEKH